MVCISCCCLGLVLVVVGYKLLDRYIRKSRIDDYSSRRIFVTGCDSGFGNLLAKRLDSFGCHVFAGCLTDAGAEALSKACSPRLTTVPLDVTSPESVRKAFDIVKAKLPTGQGLWGLLNNAGVLGRGGRIEWMTLQDYKDAMSVNIFGMIDMTVTLLPLIKLGQGRVVNTASIMGRYAYAGAVPYTMSKYCVESFSDCLRRQIRPYGVKVSIIEPGFYTTSLTNPDNVKPMLEKTWNALSEESKQEFGADYMEKVADLYKQSNKQISTRVDDVVDAYEHALLASRPRSRYVVGTDAKFMWLPLQWLPEWLGDIIIEWLFKAPLPAVLEKKRR